ncbi:hypothetical protein C5167_023754, partial [Papaver somniferum]
MSFIFRFISCFTFSLSAKDLSAKLYLHLPFTRFSLHDIKSSEFELFLHKIVALKNNKQLFSDLTRGRRCIEEQQI